MRTKFRFQEQLDIYVLTHYKSADIQPMMPCQAQRPEDIGTMMSCQAQRSENIGPMMSCQVQLSEADKNTRRKDKKSESAFLKITGGFRNKKSSSKVTMHTLDSKVEIENFESEESELCEYNDDYEIFTGESELEERIQHISDSFGRYMMYLVEAKGKTSSEVQNGAWITRKVYSKINTNQDSYHPDKRTAFQICVGLGLNMDETKDLIRRAGYDFSPSEKEDVIWSFFFEREPIDYDIFDISDALEKYGLKPVVVLKSGYEKV